MWCNDVFATTEIGQTVPAEPQKTTEYAALAWQESHCGDVRYSRCCPEGKAVQGADSEHVYGQSFDVLVGGMVQIPVRIIAGQMVDTCA